MKKYCFEIVLYIIQLCLIYLLPIISGPTDVMGMVLVGIIATLILSLLNILFSKCHIKYFYPCIVSILYIPTVFIFISCKWLYLLWYFLSSLYGLIIGLLILFIKNKKH